LLKIWKQLGSFEVGSWNVFGEFLLGARQDF